MRCSEGNGGDEAREHLQASLALRESLEERGWQASGHVALSLCERLAGRRTPAVEHARRSLAIAREEGLRERFVVAAQDALDEAEALAHDGTGA